MALAEDVAEAVDRRFKTASTNLTAQVHGPMAVPPDKVQTFAALQQKKKQLLELAAEIDELIANF
jgi:hypothetical protein